MGRRIEVLDLWRSLCVVVMVLWHGVYDLALFGVLDMAILESLPSRMLAYATAGGFILIAGICSRFSRSNIHRGFRILCLGFLVAVVMALMKMPVAFGILQFFGVSMMVYGLLKEKIDALDAAWFPVLCLVLFAGSWILTGCVQVEATWLYPLGFRTENFFSADYFPLFPWLFLFLTGSWIGGRVLNRWGRNGFNRKYHPALCFTGKHSLLIYLLHQPLLYTLCRMLFG